MNEELERFKLACQDDKVTDKEIAIMFGELSISTADEVDDAVDILSTYRTDMMDKSNS